MLPVWLSCRRLERPGLASWEPLCCQSSTRTTQPQPFLIQVRRSWRPVKQRPTLGQNAKDLFPLQHVGACAVFRSSVFFSLFKSKAYLLQRIRNTLESKSKVGRLTSYAVNTLPLRLPGLFLSAVPTCEGNPACLNVQFPPEAENSAIQGREARKFASEMGRGHRDREVILREIK